MTKHEPIVLLSNVMVYTPGVLRWLVVMAKTDLQNATNILSEGWPTLPARVVNGLLTGKLTWTVDENESAVITLPDGYLD